MGTSQKRKGADFERKVANIFDTERVGTRGKPDGIHADVEHDHLYIQCKKYQRIAAYKWLKKTIDECPKNKTPIVVAQEDHGEMFVMLTMDDYLKVVDGWKGINAATEFPMESDEEVLRGLYYGSVRGRDD